MSLSESNTILTESKPEVQKNNDLPQSQEKAQLNPVEEQDSAKLLLKSSRLLLQMQETEIIASKHEKQNQASRNIGQYEYYNCFVNQTVTS